MTQPHITELFENKQPQFNCRKQKMTENHLNLIYSTRVKNNNPMSIVLLYYDQMNDCFTCENNEKSFNRSIEMKLSWPPG